MATVRFSEVLKEAILKNASDMFHKELSDAYKDTPTTWNAEYLYNTVFPKDIRDKINALPKKYMEEVSKISFGGFRNVDDSLEDKRAWNVPDLDFTFNTPHRMPHGSQFDDWDRSWRNIRLTYGTPRFATIQTEYKDWVTKQQAIRDKQDTFVAGVRQILNTYSTLSPALRVFPALWDLVPKEYQERHLTVTKRKQGSVKELGDLDVNSLTATVTLNKLTK